MYVCFVCICVSFTEEIFILSHGNLSFGIQNRSNDVCVLTLLKLHEKIMVVSSISVVYSSHYDDQEDQQRASGSNSCNDYRTPIGSCDKHVSKTHEIVLIETVKLKFQAAFKSFQTNYVFKCQKKIT